MDSGPFGAQTGHEPLNDFGSENRNKSTSRQRMSTWEALQYQWRAMETTTSIAGSLS